MSTDGPTPSPYGDRSPAAPALPPRRRRVAALTVAAAVPLLVAAIAVVSAIVTVVTAPDSGGVDFSILYTGAIAIGAGTVGCVLADAAWRAAHP